MNLPSELKLPDNEIKELADMLHRLWKKACTTENRFKRDLVNGMVEAASDILEGLGVILEFSPAGVSWTRTAPKPAAPLITDTPYVAPASLQHDGTE